MKPGGGMFVMPVYRSEFIDPFKDSTQAKGKIVIYDFLSESIKIKIYSKYLNGYGKNAKANRMNLQSVFSDR